LNREPGSRGVRVGWRCRGWLLGLLLLAACATRSGATREVTTPAAPTGVESPIEVLFAKNQHGAPDAGCTRTLCPRLTALIRGARSSVDFAIYGIRNQNAVIDALVEAQLRGVRVRGVVDTEGERCDKFSYLDTGLLWTRLAPGSVHCDAGRGHGYIMHNKFFVIDEALVWTGSTNISDTELGGEYYSDVVVLVRDAALAAAYTRELEEMLGGQYHAQKQDDTPHRFAPLSDGTVIELYFSPSDKTLEHALLPLIRGARETLDIAMFFFTEPSVAQALVDAAARGVAVRMVLDAGGAENKYSRHLQLCQADVPVKIENWGGKAHGKWAVADAALGEHARVIVGSLNWTAAADRHNDENTLVIASPSVAGQFAGEFARQWADLPDEVICGRVQAEGPTSSVCEVAMDCVHTCRSGSCCDGIDNDHDGLSDAREEACGCGDGLDNDEDGYVDGADYDCQVVFEIE
jgi:phosphatidylserine/phosphatidylglycerophosphate/cardiolipin synthase-like enzyme